jgi:hypothetical protein
MEHNIQERDGRWNIQDKMINKQVEFLYDIMELFFKVSFRCDLA